MDTPRPQLLDFQFHQNNDSFTLHFQQRLILTHSKDNPWEGANKQVISSQVDSLIKISRIWANFFPANTSNQPI
ncbi:hypothetical protein MZH69_25415 [Escherichia coli]|nr:hypothetical protein MZH69_25415 [Escherichia coli]